MKTFFTLLIFIFCFTITVSAQAPKAVYAEFGGPGLFSFNFDTRFSQKSQGIGGRIGIGGWKIDQASTITIPVGINYLLGKDDRHYFEIGAGFTPVFYNETSENNDDNSNLTSSFGHLYFGYRLQPKDGGFLFRAGMSPVFGNGFFIPYLIGVSLGYTF